VAYSGEQPRTYKAGGHRIRHYGLFASNLRAGNLAMIRTLIAASSLLPQANAAPKPDPAGQPVERCPHCGGRMLIIERFEGACRPRKTPCPAKRFDTS
jgi:DNA-directed RNA polymerase subunit RPC12/RpoP